MLARPILLEPVLFAMHYLPMLKFWVLLPLNFSNNFLFVLQMNKTFQKYATKSKNVGFKHTQQWYISNYILSICFYLIMTFVHFALRLLN